MSAAGANAGAPRVLITGGGLAGLAAASALGPRGFAVTVIESRQRLGGRASSFTDAATGQTIDACQHVTMGCCTNFAHFCRTTGIDGFLEPQATLWFMTRDRRISRFVADPLPAPLHFARSLLSAHYLTFGDKMRIGWGMLQLLRADPDNDIPLLPWLKRNRQNERTIRRFWEVVLVSALNERIESLGLKYARKVFREAFLKDRRGFEVRIPKVPLIRLYGEELLGWFGNHDVAIETNAAAAEFELEGQHVRAVRLRDGSRRLADFHVLAVPFERVPGLFPEAALARNQELNPGRKLQHSPITSVHCWFDRPIFRHPHLVLVDCVGHWVFSRGETMPGEHYYQVVISAAHELGSGGVESIQRCIIEELRHLFPVARRASLMRVRVVTERTATFRPHPGVDQSRPRQETAIDNLILAGDWTDTGWPATMEGAVRSGYLAAEVILQKTGRPERLVQPGLA